MQALWAMIAPVTLMIYAVATLLCVLSGPFGTYHSMSMPDRLVFWPLALALSFIGVYATRALMMCLCGPDRPLLLDIGRVALATLVVAPTLYYLRVWMFPDTGPVRTELLRMIVYVGSIIASVAFVKRLVPGLANPFHALGIGLPPPRARLAEWLEHGDAQILRLSVDGHFVDVTTTAGTERLRMRFADAVREMEPIEGFTTHRSHWVSAGAIQRAEREGGRWVLRLVNGDVVPVSRSGQSRLAEAGIITDAPLSEALESQQESDRSGLQSRPSP